MTESKALIFWKKNMKLNALGRGYLTHAAIDPENLFSFEGIVWSMRISMGLIYFYSLMAHL